MLKAHDLIALATLLIVVTFSLPVIAAPGGVQSRDISEYPAGQVDGNNQAFFLSVLPADADGVRLFLNDQELASREDFTVIGRKVVLAPRFVPHQGDTLRVSFHSDAALQGSASSDPPVSGTMTPPATEQSPVDAIPPDGGSADNSMSSGSTASITIGTQMPSSKSNDVASLAFLNRRLVEQRRSSDKARTSMKISEATGDLPIISPYSRLLGVESKDDPLGELSHPVHVRTIIIGSQLRSIEILQQRLDATNQEGDEKSVRGKR